MSASTRPPVALETTLLCHGVPRSRALEVQARVEAAVRAQGAEPMLIGVVDGEVQIGIDRDGLARMLEHDAIVKIGARGIAGALARGQTAATTVSATMAIAAAQGIQVFATGGLGGVHRGAAESFDESEDLGALARYRVAVVSAGAKAILDLPKTLERLETLGVPVVGMATDSFTAFYSNDSGLAVPERVDAIDPLARLCHQRLQGPFGQGGVLVVNRVPAEHELDAAQVEAAVSEAVAAAERQDARGAAATPAALAYLNQLEGGRFLDTNIALVESNAGLAAQLAVALARVNT